MTKRANQVLTTREACHYLKISRPTYLKLVYANQIRAKKLGRGWKILRSELQTYMTRQD
jgi:excisionase family DNA binding protein